MKENACTSSACSLIIRDPLSSLFSLKFNNLFSFFLCLLSSLLCKRKTNDPRNMIRPNFMEEIDCGSFFDPIDDLLLDVPGGEEIETAGLDFVDGSSFPTIWTAETESSLPGSESLPSSNSNSDISAELSVPYEDIVQLEWLSTFVEESFSGGGNLTIKNNIVKRGVPSSVATAFFQTYSPVSVLESSSLCSGDKTVPQIPEQASVTPTTGGEKKKQGRGRTKRSRRPTTLSPRPHIQLLPSPTSPDNSRLVIKMPKQALSDHKKRKRIKVAPGGCEENEKENVKGSGRKCMHCEVTKTPQWRVGPMGPKTLCNACGVRYKSGRLFPEYRPAASPTFVPSVHSNSHRKVLEMRSKHVEKGFEETAPTDSEELIPNKNNNLAMDQT